MTHKLFRLACAGLFASVCALSSAAQDRTADAARPGAAAPPQSASSSDANEEFDLNIDVRRITEENFEASLSVALGAQGRHGLDLRVGVAVSASRIDLLLKDVRGRVRFRATLGQVLRLVNERRAAGVESTIAVPPLSASP